MKKTLTFLFIPLVTLTGCAKYHKPVDTDYYCQRIIRKMHTEAPRYRASGSNKRIATEHAKLQREYYHYDCELYQARKDAASRKSGHFYVGAGTGIGVN